MRNFMDSSVVEHKSKPPLRWIANWAGSIASSGLLIHLDISFMDGNGIHFGLFIKNMELHIRWIWI